MNRGRQREVLQDRAGYWELVRRNPDFRFLWFGQIVSLLGDWFNLIASAALVANLTKSGAAVGGLFAVRMLAPFFVSPMAGVAVDRYNRKRMLILADLMRAMVVLGFLTVRRPGDIWLLYALSAVQLGISGFFFPARNAILPSLVSGRELGAANALSSATWSIMLALGTALGGLITGAFGLYPAFVIDSLSFLFSAGLIAFVRYIPFAEIPGAAGGIASGFRLYIEGLRYLYRHSDIFAISLQKAVLSLTSVGGLHVVQVALAERVFVIGKGGGIGMGIIFAIVGVGTGMGPIIARRFTGDRDSSLRIAIGLSYLMIAAGVATAATLSSFGIVLVGFLLRGIGGGIVWVFTTQLLMKLAPADVRGRIFATEFALFTLMNAISAGVSGWAIDTAALGMTGTMWWMAILSIVPAVLWGLHVRKSGSVKELIEGESE